MSQSVVPSSSVSSAAHPGSPEGNLPALPQGVSPLPHLGVIRAEGEDAAHFLHNQLTQDVLLLDASQARLAAYCNAKGRMQASFVLCKPSPTEVLLVCRRDLLAPTLKRLSLFVLRAKVKLSDASAEFSLRGLVGSAVNALAAPSTPWQRHALPEAAQLIGLYPALGLPRALWLAPGSVTPPTGEPMDPQAWLYGEVMSGIAWVEQACFEAFVPQMLNYESVDGVNFKKGCYPGQEVVARSQFRGTLKRRAFIVRCEQSMQAGQEVFSSADASQPCGLIAQAASLRGVHVAIAEIQLAAREQGSLHLGSAIGPALHTLPLPYPLRDDI